MIKNAILVFAILFAGHVAVVSTCFTKADPEDYEAANLELGRQFLSNADQYECVIVGSSMGAKIDPSLMPMEAFNLSFTGRGALDGLGLIQHSGAHPRVILVELNTIFRGENADFTAKLTNPYFRILSRGSHEMPVNYMVEFSAYLKRRLSGRRLPQPTSAADVPTSAADVPTSSADVPTSAVDVHPSSPADDAIEAKPVAEKPTNDDDGGNRNAFTKIIQSNIGIWQSLPDYYPLEENLEAIENYVASFAQHGTLVIFIEMPCHPAIATSPRFQILREAIRDHGKLKTVPVIKVDDLTAFQSNDGLHLTYESRGPFSSFLADQLELHILGSTGAD